MMSNLIIFACFCRISFLHAFVPSAKYIIDSYGTTSTANAISSRSSLLSSPFDDLIGGLFGNDDEKEKKSKIVDDSTTNSKGADDEDDAMSLSFFQEELARRQQVEETNPNEDEDEFNGYDLRDIIYAKYGECFDVQFQRVDSYGVRAVYLNIMPFRLGGKKFRHETEYDYLCHLQATVEILVKYNQLDFVISQLMETDKKPRAGTSPLVAVPLRLDLTPEQVNKILG